jgi:hypothetical protein
MARACCPLWRPQAVGLCRVEPPSPDRIRAGYETSTLCRRYGGTLIESGAEVSAASLGSSNQGKVIFRDLATSGSDVDMGCGRPEIAEMEEIGWQ